MLYLTVIPFSSTSESNMKHLHVVPCQVISDKWVIFFFTGVVENSWGESWARPLIVCVLEGPGIVVIDSSHRGARLFRKYMFWTPSQRQEQVKTHKVMLLPVFQMTADCILGLIFFCFKLKPNEHCAGAAFYTDRRPTSKHHDAHFKGVSFSTPNQSCCWSAQRHWTPDRISFPQTDASSAAFDSPNPLIMLVVLLIQWQ